MSQSLIRPDWPAPGNIVGASTTRIGGCSKGPFAGLNFGDHVGDSPAAVASNRAWLMHSLGLTRIQWLQQVHGIAVHNADAASHAVPEADAAISTIAGVGCAVMTADCLPVLLCNAAGTQVAAVHAGWRGLAAGVIQAAVAAFHSEPQHLLAWLGPAIGASQFEVGGEVLARFRQSTLAGDKTALANCFRPANNEGKYLADIYALARLALASVGVTSVWGGEFCTVSQDKLFYSYRRDTECGRMASVIAIV